MTPQNQHRPTSIQSRKLPRRDLFLLPAIALFTICTLTGAVLLLADLSLSRQHTLREDCMVFNDRSTGPRGIPNSVCWENNLESQPVEYRFDSCGYRSGMECGAKPAGTYRIVLVGSSVAFGAWVPRENTFAAVLPAELSRRTGRTIDVYNEGIIWKTPRNLPLAFNQIMAAHPDMILWVIGPWELEHLAETGPSQEVPPPPPSQPDPPFFGAASSDSASASEPGFLGHTRYRIKQAFAEKSLAATASELVDVAGNLLLSQYNAKLGPTVDRLLASMPHDERIRVFFQHYLYQSESQYIKATLMDRQETEFLLENPGPGWQSRMDQFDRYAADVELKAKAAGVPFVTVLLPTRAQAAMISMGEWPAGYDPYKVGAEVQAVITRHGGTYIDILPEFRSVPGPEMGYFPVDGHLNAEGHATAGRLLAKSLTTGVSPVFQAAELAQNEPAP
jgi:hypothetical protein